MDDVVRRTQRQAPSAYGAFETLPIAGTWRRGKANATLTDPNPYSGEVIAEISQGDRDDLDQAYTQAAKAQPAWAAKVPFDRQTVNDLPNCPFGGEKNSGLGRFGGDWAVEAFTTDQWVSVQHQPRHFPRHAEEVRGPWGGG